MLTPALVVEKPGDPFKLQDVELDTQLRDDEVQVRLMATGVCHTDINFSKEETMPELFPGVLGHEGAGIIEKVGREVTSLSVGDHVICYYSSCGECRFCQRKETSFCDRWFQYNFGIGRLDGSKAFRSPKSGKLITSHFFGQSSFANNIVVKQTGCLKVATDLPFDKLAPLGCGFMTGAGGTGAVGLAAVMACKMLSRPPKRVIAVDVVPSRLELARKYGATHGVNSKVRPDLMKVLMDITDGQGVDGAIDTTGRPDVLKNLIHSSARKGKVVSVGVGQLSAEAPLNIFEMVNAGCSYVGCNQGNCYPPEFLPRLIDANQQGKFPYDKLIKTYAVQDIDQAVEDIKDGSTVKAVLQWE